MLGLYGDNGKTTRRRGRGLLQRRHHDTLALAGARATRSPRLPWDQSLPGSPYPPDQGTRVKIDGYASEANEGNLALRIQRAV